MVEAGIRCEEAFDSKTTDPVLRSIIDTDGLLSSGAAAKRAKTPAAEIGSNADALGACKRLAATMAAQKLKNFFI